MKLYILGKNTDDKGSQLEDLTRDILASQGYENIVQIQCIREAVK